MPSLDGDPIRRGAASRLGRMTDRPTPKRPDAAAAAGRPGSRAPRPGPAPRARSASRASRPSATSIEPLYGPWSVPDDADARIGLPGEPPFTRGIHPSGYRSRLWTMRMFAGLRRRRGHQRPVQAPARRRPDRPLDRLRHADALRLRHRRRRGRGRVRDLRRRRQPLADMEVLLDGLPLDRVSTSMTINSPAAPIWAMYIVAAEKAGVPRAALEGTTPERHPQGVHRPEGVPVPARAVDAPRDRHDRVRDARDAALEHDLDLAATTSARPARPRSRSWRSRSPTGWPTSRRRSSAGLRVDDFAPRLSLLLQQPQRLLRGDRQVPGARGGSGTSS